MQISVVSHREPEPLDLAAFERLAGFVLEREEAPDAIELSIAVVALDEMADAEPSVPWQGRPHRRLVVRVRRPLRGRGSRRAGHPR